MLGKCCPFLGSLLCKLSEASCFANHFALFCLEKAWVAGGVNKVFAKVSKNTSKVQIEKVGTNIHNTASKHDNNSNDDRGEQSKYHHNNTGVTP